MPHPADDYVHALSRAHKEACYRDEQANRHAEGTDQPVPPWWVLEAEWKPSVVPVKSRNDGSPKPHEPDASRNNSQSDESDSNLGDYDFNQVFLFPAYRR